MKKKLISDDSEWSEMPKGGPRGSRSHTPSNTLKKAQIHLNFNLSFSWLVCLYLLAFTSRLIPTAPRTRRAVYMSLFTSGKKRGYFFYYIVVQIIVKKIPPFLPDEITVTYVGQNQQLCSSFRR